MTPEDQILKMTNQPPVAAIAPSAPPIKQPAFNLGSQYMAHVDDMEGHAALEELQKSQAQQQTKPEQKPQEPQISNQPVAGQAMIYDDASGKYIPDPNVKPSNFTAGAVLSDVGKGALEALPTAVRGARDSFQAMLDGARDLGQWVEQKAGLNALATLDAKVPALNMPDVGKVPTTVTGGVVKSISQFVTGMATFGKVFQSAELPSTVKAAMTLFAGFEGKSGRLSDLIQKVPELQNPVTDFLSSKPDDNEATARLKNAVEGLGLGAVSDGLVSAIRMVKGGQEVQAALQEAAPEASLDEAQPPVVAKPPSGFSLLGNAEDTESPLVQLKKPEKVADSYLATTGVTPEGVKAADITKPQIAINFARIDTPDDVRTAMQQMADTQAEDINLARRGIRSFEQTKLGAQATDAWQTLMDRREGSPLNAEQMLAARQLWQQSAAKTNEIMQAAVDNPSPENLMAFRKQFATHAMIQQEVVAARTETARSLGAMRIPVGAGDAERLSQIVDTIQQTGGLQSNLDFLQKVKGLADEGRLFDMGNVAEKTAYARTRDAFLDGWVNGLLTNPLTHVKVALSNASTIALRLTETQIAESVAKLTGDQSGVVAGETAQTAAGLVQSLKDAFRYIGKQPDVGQSPINDAIQAFKTGRYNVGEQLPDWAVGSGDNLSQEALGLSQSGWAGSGMDLAGQLIRTPGRALTAEHEFFRSIGMRMELNRYAIRQATEELNAGTISEDAFDGRVAQLVENPPPNISTAAVTGMTYQTFTDAPGKFAETIQQLRYNYPAVRLILPFYKIPSRILSFTFERSPFAPLMQSYQSAVEAGGARAQMARAQMGLGSAIMLATADSVLNGQITGSGPTQKGEKEALYNEGWLPYSVKVGDRWVQYNRLETIGSSMAMAADVTQTIKDYHEAVNTDDPNVEKLVAAATLAVAQDITSKTYLEGLSRFFEAMANPKYGGESLLKSYAGSTVPAGVGSIARAMDPYNREVYSMLDAIKARTPGISKDLPPQRNLWGEPVSHESGLGKAYDAFVPFASRQSNDEPIDREILRLGSNVAIPPAQTSINGVKVDLSRDPKMYSRYQELSGNGYKNPAWGLGAKDLLNQIVTGQHPLSAVYNLKTDGPDGGKDVMIQDIIRQYREAARTQMLDEFPKLRAQVEQQQDKQRELRMIQ